MHQVFRLTGTLALSVHAVTLTCTCPAKQVVQLAGGIRKVVPTVAGGAAPPASSKPAAPAAAINPLIAAAQAAASKLAAQARCHLRSPRSIAHNSVGCM